jgi:hypothetical protein
MSAESRKLVKITERLADEHGVRFCTNCNATRPKEGGVWVVYQNGLRRRWKCGTCVRAAKERLQNEKVV